MDKSSSSRSKNPSARKLGASLWEAQAELLPLCKRMSRNWTSRAHLGSLSDHASETESPPRTHSAARLMRHVEASLDQHRKLPERAIGELKPQAPSSYNSSMEISSLNQASSPSSSMDLKGRCRESGHSIRTSAEFVKILNRIWSLEEQLATNISLVKNLKLELHHAHSHIQELMQERLAYRHEMDDLMKRVSDDRITRKNKEQERIKAAVQFLKNELEDERKLRRQSETLHHKFGKELSKVNSTFEITLNDLESERKLNGLLEYLCDDFAKGVQQYEQEILNLKHKSGEDCNHRFNQLLHHISKVWMDERSQMKIAEAQGEEAKKSRMLERLASEVASSIHATKVHKSKGISGFQNDKKDSNKDSSLRHHSLESFHLNVAASAPRLAEDDDYSVVSDLQCFELNMVANDNLSQGYSRQNGSVESSNQRSIGTSILTNEKLKERRSLTCNENNMHFIDCSRGESSHHPDNEHIDSCKQFSVSGNFTLTGEASASDMGDPHNIDASVTQLNHQRLSSDPKMSKCSSTLLQAVKENSLKEKLHEARLEGRNVRLRALKGSSGGVL